MSWYKQSKDENDFDFSDEEKEIWRSMVKEEQDAVGIHFDLENDESISSIRRIKLKTKNKSMVDMGSGDLTVFVELYSAGGDWQNPVGYFRCQIKEKNHWGPKFVYIPEKNKGNANLVSSKKEGEFIAGDNNDDEYTKLNERELWRAFRDHVEKRADEFYNKNKDVDEAKEYGMYDNRKSLSLV